MIRLSSALLLVGLLGSGPGARAQSPLVERNGFSVLVSEFNERGSFGTYALTEELGGLDSPDHHRFGIDVTALQRFKNGVALGLRGGLYRYDPVGLGGRVGLVASGGRGLWRGADVRLETETAYIQGRFDAGDIGYTAAAVQGDAAILIQQRVPLFGSVDLRVAVGPYVNVTNTHNAWDVDGDARPGSRYEQVVAHGGAQVGAALTFALLDARVAIAPTTRLLLAETDQPAAFSATPGAGIWVDF